MTGQRPNIPVANANYAAIDHGALQQQVTQKVDAGQAGGIADEWKKFGQRLVDAAIAFKTMEAGTSAMWSGKAADGAQAKFASFTQAADVLGQQHNAVGTAIHQQTSAAQTAKDSMPPPVPYEPGKMLKEAAASGNPFKMAATLFTIPAQKAASEEAKAQAVQVMQTRDSTFAASAATMPTFTELPPIKDDPPGPPPKPLPYEVPPGGGGDRNIRPPGGITTPPGTTGTPPNIIPPVVPPGPNQNRPGQNNTTRPSWQTGNQGNQNQQNQRQGPGPNQGLKPQIPIGQFPPGTRPGSPPPGSRPGGAAAAKAGGAGGFGGAGKPGGSFGPSNPGGQTQTPGGRAGVMGPGAGPQQGGFGPSNAGSAGRAGAMGAASGMGAGAGAGQGDEDKEHKSPGYLLDTDDVFGDGETLVAPPVIGE